MTDVHRGAGQDPTPRLTTMSTRGGSVSFAVPEHWDAIELSPDGDVVAAVEPDDSDRFRTNVVLTFAEVQGSLADWQRTTQQRESQELDGYLLLDHEHATVGGRAGLRRLTTHSTPAHESVTTESWTTLVDGTGVTLTTRVGTLRLGQLGPVLDAVAASLVMRTDGLVPA
ncbi:hypothetical protein [Terrabacter sp. LjRoot27]|uniref:hypothetical protein n=1 Tax=Terrabacter sp. LjRoot27 TaxID=3342306 RepID=UPI003F4F7573